MRGKFPEGRGREGERHTLHDNEAFPSRAVEAIFFFRAENGMKKKWGRKPPREERIPQEIATKRKNKEGGVALQ